MAWNGTESGRGFLKLADLVPGNINTFFYTLGGAEAMRTLKAARYYTGRHKVLSRYRSSTALRYLYATHRRPTTYSQ